MKTKKILAILTLMAFMISILPMAAFAAATPFGSFVEVEEATAEADGDDYLEYSVFVRATNASTSLSGSTLYVATNRGAIDEIYFNSATATASDFALTGTGSEWVTVKIKSDIASNGKVAFGLLSLASTTDYVMGGSNAPSATQAQIIGDKAIDFTFTPVSANSVILSAVSDNAFANGTSFNEVKATVTANGIPVSGKEVTFSLDKSGATLSASKVTTDSKGEAKVKIFASKPGTYKVTAKADGVDAMTATKSDSYFTSVKVDQVGLNFNPIDIVTIVAESDNNQKIARETSGTVSFKFSFKDSNGNTITPTSTMTDYNTTSGNFTSGNLNGAELRVLTKPSGVAIGEKPGSSDVNTIVLDGSKLEIKINKSRLDKDGAYELRLSLANGKSVVYAFTVQKQGTVTGMTVSYDSTALAGVSADATATDKPTVKLLDAEGYATEVTLPHADVTFSTSNPNMATVASDGVITAKKDAVGTFIITTVHSDKGLVATTSFTINKAAASLAMSAPSYNVVGESTEVKAQLVDVDGKAVSNNQSLASGDVKVVITGKPAGSIVTVDTASVGDYKDKGFFTFKITSNTAGTVSYQVVATDGGSTSYAGNGSVVFGEAGAAKQALIMFIGSQNYLVGGAPAVTDAAPFIENGRTFVAVRPIGDALNSTIYWDAATQTVTLVKPGETVTIVIGSSVIKVDRAGVVTEYPTDSPAQIKDGRTYLPFRAIGEAMGYTVTWDAATQSVIFS